MRSARLQEKMISWLPEKRSRALLSTGVRDKAPSCDGADATANTTAATSARDVTVTSRRLLRPFVSAGGGGAAIVGYGCARCALQVSVGRVVEGAHNCDVSKNSKISLPKRKEVLEIRVAVLFSLSSVWSLSRTSQPTPGVLDIDAPGQDAVI